VVLVPLNVDWCKVRFSELEIEPGIFFGIVLARNDKKILAIKY
jgi:hypothetical protein